MDARTVEIKQDILFENAREGEALRSRLAERGVKMVNLMASPCVMCSPASRMGIARCIAMLRIRVETIGAQVKLKRRSR